MSNSETPTSDNAFWQENDEKIKAAIHSLGAAGLPINIARITDQLIDCIVQSYDNTMSLFIYKSSWCTRICQVLTELNITYNKSRPNWENIAMIIHDQRLGIVHPTAEQFGSVSSGVNESINASSNSSTSAFTSLGSDSSSTSKQIKLSPLQKENIIDMFAKLNETEMWRLSTGKVVEQQMKICALECKFEQ